MKSALADKKQKKLLVLLLQAGSATAEFRKTTNLRGKVLGSNGWPKKSLVFFLAENRTDSEN